jgi:hypothetical protein
MRWVMTSISFWRLIRKENCEIGVHSCYHGVYSLDILSNERSGAIICQIVMLWLAEWYHSLRGSCRNWR